MHAELVIEFEKPTGRTDCALGPSQEGHPRSSSLNLHVSFLMLKKKEMKHGQTFGK